MPFKVLAIVVIASLEYSRCVFLAVPCVGVCDCGIYTCFCVLRVSVLMFLTIFLNRTMTCHSM